MKSSKYRAKATPRHTERKRHPAKAVKAKPAKKATAKKAKPAPKKVAKKVQPKAKPAKKTPAKKVAKKAVKAKPAKKATVKKAKPALKKVAKKVQPKAKPAKKTPAKKVAKKAVKAKPAKKATVKKAYRASATPRQPAPKRVAKKVAKKPVKKAKPAKVPVKKARGRPKRRSKDSASAAPSPSSRREAKREAKPAEYRAPATPRLFHPRRETGALIISKRGRKSKKERAAAESQAIFVPRDVKAENTEENQTRDARAYSPDELEQLLSSRGVSNMNVFDPKTAITAKVEKKKAQKKIILTTLPKAKKKKTVGPVSVSDLFGFNPFAKNSTSQEEKLIPEKWRKYYRKLMDRKEALLARLNDHSEKAFQKEGKEETGDVSAYSQHTADIDNDAFDRDLALSRLPAEQEELSEINIAIERMKKGTYGICEITGKPIPAERLNKVPFTRYSLEGKLEAEKQRGLAARRRRANTTGDISEVIDLENDAPVQLPEEETEEQQ